MGFFRSRAALATVCALALLLCAVPATAEDPVPTEQAAEAAPAEKAAEAADEEPDETKELLKQLTIGMVTDVVDERTLEIRDSKFSGGKMHLKLGNVASPRQGAAHTNEEHAARLERAKASLTQLVGKQMVWYKLAPEEHQPSPAEGQGKDTAHVVLADIWLYEGRHVNSLLAKEGHLDRDKTYHSDLARNILGAEAEEKKQDSYKELAKAMKEHDQEKKKHAKEQVEREMKEEELKGEPIGIAGWIGLVFLVVLVTAALCNFGRDRKKKVNLNRKRGMFEKFWMKLKGA